MKTGRSVFIPGLLAAFCLLNIGLERSEGEDRITVMNPRGFPTPIRLIPMAPRLDSLDGKTVYFVDVRYPEGDVFLREMMAWFSRHMPKTKLVFKQKEGAYADNDPNLWKEIKEKGDAMIMAIGH
jgi:hypothetical protein